MELLLEQQRVGAKVDVLLARDEAGDDLGDLRMQQWLAARDGDHGRATLVHRAQALLHRELLAEHVSGILDLAAAGAGQVAAKERFQHQHQWVALAALDLLLQDVGGDRPHLGNRNSHVRDPNCSTWNMKANSLSLLQNLWHYVKERLLVLPSPGSDGQDTCEPQSRHYLFNNQSDTA